MNENAYNQKPSDRWEEQPVDDGTQRTEGEYADETSLEGEPLEENELTPEEQEELLQQRRKRKRDIILVTMGVLLFLFVFLSLWTAPEDTKQTATTTKTSTSTGGGSRVVTNITPTPAPSTLASGGSSTLLGGGGSGGGAGGSGGAGGAGASGSGGLDLTTHNYFNYYYYTTASPTPNPTVTPSKTPTPSPTYNPTPTPSSQNPTPTPTNYPTQTPTPAPSYSPTPTPAVLGESTEGQKGQMVGRSVLLGSSIVDSFTTADFTWKPATTAVVKAIKIKVCTNPSDNTACVAPSNASFSASSLGSTGGELGGGWTYTVNSANEVVLVKAAGATLSAGVTQTIGIDNFRNPTSYGTFYYRMITYSTDTYANVDSIDFGAFAASTAKSITVTGDVAETLLFRVGNTVNSDCTGGTDIADPNDTTEDLVTLDPNPMMLTQASTGTAQFCVATNAQSGYRVTYFDELGSDNHHGFWNGAHEFIDGLFTNSPGSQERFGFNLVANTNPAVGSNPSPDATPDYFNAGYSTADTFNYESDGSVITLVGQNGPSASNVYTLSYVANITPLTPAGTYLAQQIFIATATF